MKKENLKVVKVKEVNEEVKEITETEKTTQPETQPTEKTETEKTQPETEKTAVKKLYEFEIKNTNDLIKSLELAGRDDIFNVILPLKMVLKRGSLKKFVDDWNTFYITNKVFEKTISDGDLLKNKTELYNINLALKKIELTASDVDDIDSINLYNQNVKDLKAAQREASKKVKQAEEVRHNERVQELLSKFTWFNNKQEEKEEVKETEKEEVKEEVKETEKK